MASAASRSSSARMPRGVCLGARSGRTKAAVGSDRRSGGGDGGPESSGSGSERGHATGSFALGEPLFLEMLHTTEHVDVPLAQLLAVGRADLERNTRALPTRARSTCPGHAAACVEKVRRDKPAGGAVEAREHADRAARLHRQERHRHDPRDGRPLIAEAPPYNRDNSAYIDVPVPTTRMWPTYYIAPPDPSWPPQKRAEYIPGKASLLFTSVHEVWPGHFLQFLHSIRYRSMIAASASATPLRKAGPITAKR